MSLMTDHIEGSARVHTSIFEDAKNRRFQKMEEKAYKQARKAGAPRAIIATTSFADSLGLQGRGWEVDDRVSVGIASLTKIFLGKNIEE